MAETHNASADFGAGIDLSQFYQVFFEEAGENLDRMEQLLLAIDVASADDEELNAIFRCAHSIKGGAATFGFADVAELTHQMETLLDKMRRHELQPTRGMVDVLLQSGDALRAQLARHQGGGGEVQDTSELLANIRAFVSGERAAAPAAAPAVVVAASPAVPMPPVVEADVPVNLKGERILELVLGPLDKPELAASIVELFKEIEGLGQIEPIDG
ncbi:MAG TPA: Hpt domain-containing protein, partial [Methylibium sp.]|uniref:Hpt domain-containing protein n=1 Tax=Methylibium sp. TaxID=2067992 RepID=UPI002DBF0EDE